MFGRRGDGRHLVDASLAVYALLVALPAGAGLLTTDQTLANFQFVGGAVDYAPDPTLVTLPTDSASAFSATDPDLGYGGADRAQDPLRGSVHVAAKNDNFGNFVGSDFNVFGSLPRLSASPEAELANAAVTAQKPDSKRGALEFLIGRDLIIGRLASQYRGVGIFMLVAGVDEATWVQGFADGAATMELLRVEDEVANGTALPGSVKDVPLPGTLGLLLAGLPLLRRCRTRRSAPRG